MLLQQVNENTFPELYKNGSAGTILALLKDGNRLHLCELQRLTGLPERKIKDTVQHIRRNGVCVVTDYSAGYWLPSTVDELRAYIKQEEARAHSTLFTIDIAKQLYTSFTGGGSR